MLEDASAGTKAEAISFDFRVRRHSKTFRRVKSREVGLSRRLLRPKVGYQKSQKVIWLSEMCGYGQQKVLQYDERNINNGYKGTTGARHGKFLLRQLTSIYGMDRSKSDTHTNTPPRLQ